MFFTSIGPAATFSALLHYLLTHSLTLPVSLFLCVFLFFALTHSLSHSLTLQVLASVLFMFFTSIGPAATFSALLQSKTDDTIGFVEVMVSTAVTGALWAFFAGQPLVILVSE
jgi:hypothetical protein